MSHVTLVRPDVALFADVEATRVVLPRMTAMTRTRRFDQASVRFEGDDYPITLRGEGRWRQLQVLVRFMAGEHATMDELLTLFEDAQDATDGRLQLRPNAFTVPGLNPIEVVTVAEPVETPVGGRIWDVSFTATRVTYTPEV